jgi:hypothetical protein
MPSWAWQPIPKSEAFCCCEVVVTLQVKFSANTDYEMINNYKMLQSAFNKLGIDKVRECSLDVSSRALQTYRCSQLMHSSELVR